MSRRSVDKIVADLPMRSKPQVSSSSAVGMPTNQIECCALPQRP